MTPKRFGSPFNDLPTATITRIIQRFILDDAQADPDWTPACPTCHGLGYFKRDASSYFACSCPCSVAKQDDHDDTDIEWSDPAAHEELANDIERHEGVHPLEDSYLDACTTCGDKGSWIIEHPWNQEPIWTRCSCAAGDPETTYPGPLLVNPPAITYTDADALTV